MFGTFRLVMVIALIGSLAGAGFYVNKLRSDNAILKANQIKLESAVEDQKAVIQDQKISYEKILDANKKLNITISTQKRELDDLNQRFNKNNRDIGKLELSNSVKEDFLFVSPYVDDVDENIKCFGLEFLIVSNKLKVPIIFVSK